MSEHTKTPWLTEKGLGGFPDIVSEDCGEIVGCEGFYGEFDRDWANARYIVKAANYHYRLVKALNGLFDMWDGPLYMEWEDARALLAELEKQQ